MTELRISTEASELDLSVIHKFLSQESYWARGIPLDVVRKSVANSLCFGGFVGTEQVAFARVISDYATFANLVDVFVLPSHRGHGFSKAMMRRVVDHPWLQGVRRFTLATVDAHGLYAEFGFTPLTGPDKFMERYTPNAYTIGT